MVGRYKKRMHFIEFHRNAELYVKFYSPINVNILNVIVINNTVQTKPINVPNVKNSTPIINHNNVNKNMDDITAIIKNGLIFFNNIFICLGC